MSSKPEPEPEPEPTPIGAGFTYPLVPISWTKRDVILFAYSIGCTEEELHFLYELHPNFSVFPTFAFNLHWKRTSSDTIDAVALKASINALNQNIPNFPNLAVSLTVDGQRYITFLHPLPPSSADRNFALSSKLVGVYDKGSSGTVLETETTLLDTDSGRGYVKYIQSSFYPRQGNWGGTRGPSAPNYPPPKGREERPDRILVTKTTRQTALLYRLNGDYNPLHAEPAIGVKMGFGGTILHGLYSFNRAVYGILRDFGGSDAGNIREVQARFAAPVRPGETVLTKMWKMGKVEDGWEEIRFVAYIEGGKAVLTNGRAVVRCVDTIKMEKL